MSYALVVLSDFSITAIKEAVYNDLFELAAEHAIKTGEKLVFAVPPLVFHSPMFHSYRELVEQVILGFGYIGLTVLPADDEKISGALSMFFRLSKPGTIIFSQGDQSEIFLAIQQSEDENCPNHINYKAA